MGGCRRRCWSSWQRSIWLPFQRRPPLPSAVPTSSRPSSLASLSTWCKRMSGTCCLHLSHVPQCSPAVSVACLVEHPAWKDPPARETQAPFWSLVCRDKRDALLLKTVRLLLQLRSCCLTCKPHMQALPMRAFAVADFWKPSKSAGFCPWQPVAQSLYFNLTQAPLSSSPARSQAGMCRSRMVDPRTQALVTFPVTVRLNTGDYGMEQSISLVLMCQLLETKLLQLLRFRTGGVCSLPAVQDPPTCAPPCAQVCAAADHQGCCGVCSMLSNAIVRQLQGSLARGRACTGSQQVFQQELCKTVVRHNDRRCIRCR